MSSITEKQLQEVEQLIIHGEFQEAHEMINKNLKKKISKEDELSFLILKSEVAYYLGNLQEALQLAELVLKASKGLANVLLQVDALICIAASSHWFGKLSKALETAEKGLEIISSATNLPTKAIAKRKAQLLLCKTLLITDFVGDFEKGLELAKETFSFAEESAYKNIISNSLIVLGLGYLLLGEIKKSEEYFEKAFDIATKIGNKFYMAFSYLSGLVKVKVRRREYEQALDLYNKAFDLLEEIGSTSLLVFKHDMGLVYRAMFQLDKALECFQEALKYSEAVKHIAYANIGYTYFLKYELEQAQEYYLKSMKISEEINDRRVLPSILYYLVLLTLELRNLTQAKKYLERLGQISNETGFERIDRVYRFASILVLKASGVISDLVEATKLLSSFLAE